MSHVHIYTDIYLSSQSRSSSFLVTLGRGSVMVMESQLVGLLYCLFYSTRVQAIVADNHLHDFEVQDTYIQP